MSLAVQTLGNRTVGNTINRHYSAWILSALLLVFGANARLARYQFGSRNLKLATTQSYLDNDETRLEASIAALLLLWCVTVIPVFRFAATSESLLATPLLASHHSGEFDPESHLRPPPHR
jgi:hypothetical protein